MPDYPETLLHASGVEITRQPAFSVIGLLEAVEANDFDVAVREVGLRVLSTVADQVHDSMEEGEPSPPAFLINNSSRHYWVRSASLQGFTRNIVGAVERRLAERLDYFGPVYRMPNTQGLQGLVCPVPNVLLVRPRYEATDRFEALLATLPLEEDEQKSRLMQGIGLRFFRLSSLEETNAYELRDWLRENHADLVNAVRLKHIPIRRGTLYIPNDGADPDKYYQAQWNLQKTELEAGWDLEKGSATVFVCVVDVGFDLGHPDLKQNIPYHGIDVGDPSQTAAYVAGAGEEHGTKVAGVAAGRMDNSLGIVGVAGLCSLYPVKFDLSDQECAAAITHAADWVATDGSRVRVINMSFGWEETALSGIDTSTIDEAIEYADSRDCVLCAATGNGQGQDDPAKNLYPSRHPHVMACGASDKGDLRWADFLGESHYGLDLHNGVQTGVSVVAPGAGIWTTEVASVYGVGTGTSFATPHVSGLAALLISRYGLSSSEVRNVIERTAVKVREGAEYVYAEDPAFSNGRRHREVGYGRIDAYRALDFADVFIKDWPGDDGAEPSQPPDGNFWCCSDIVVRPSNDDVFLSEHRLESSRVTRGRQNWLYVRVTNRGPQEARNVAVNVRITPWVGLQFAYPDDWTLIDSSHVVPAPVQDTFSVIPPGGEEIAKFIVSAAQAEQLWGWSVGNNWHPCILAEVSAENDYAWQTASTTGGRLLTRRNNLAQRNLSVVSAAAGQTVTFPFVVGHRLDLGPNDRFVVALSKLPRPIRVHVVVDSPADLFPLLAKTGAVRRSGIGRIYTDMGRLSNRKNQRVVEIRWPATWIQIEMIPRKLLELHLEVTIPNDAVPGETYEIGIWRERSGHGITGGASVVFLVD